ncbi:MAG: DUF308 domain-containing protein [Filomicrobium sp.]
MTSNTITAPKNLEMIRDRFLTTVAENRGWFVLVGAITVAAGIAALAHPVVSTIAIEIFMGSLFVAVGLMQIVMAFATRNWSGVFLQVLVGLVYLFAGGLLITRPVEGTVALTIAAGMAFMSDGVVRLIWSSQMSRGSAWFWLLLSGVIAIAAGAALVAGFAQAAPYALGVLAGINFLVTGWATMTLAIVANGPGDQPEETKTT